MVLAGEVGGRWLEETATFLRLLAVARARSESALMRRRAEQAWRMRWGGMLACAAARAFAASLLEQRSNVGGDGIHPLLSDVLSKFRHAGLGQCGTVLNLCDCFHSLPWKKKDSPKLEKDNQMLSLRDQGQLFSPQIRQKFNGVLHFLAQLNSWDTWPSVRVGQHPQNCECAWCQ